MCALRGQVCLIILTVSTCCDKVVFGHGDRIMYYVMFVSVPTLAVPDNWYLEVQCTTVERKDESKTTLGAAG